jgi:[ribosomal protein S5]-alanine N-acetyltransferase
MTEIGNDEESETDAQASKMNTARILETRRLQLRPYSDRDIPELLPLIGAREVAATTLRIPHPYTEQDARQFLASTRMKENVWLGIRMQTDGRLIGGVGLSLNRQHQNAELGYWIGVSFWGKGYATEAAQEMLRHGFQDIGLHRIFASHFKGNSASGRVLTKLGMGYEGRQREHVFKWGEFIDSELYGLLRSEWENRTQRLKKVTCT